MYKLLEVKNENVLTFTEEHQYVVLNVDVFGPCGDTIGDIELKNIGTNEVEKYAIWIGDDDLSWFYVCLSTNDEYDGESDVYNLDEFDIPFEYYSNLSWD